MFFDMRSMPAEKSARLSKVKSLIRSQTSGPPSLALASVTTTVELEVSALREQPQKRARVAEPRAAARKGKGLGDFIAQG